MKAAEQSPSKPDYSHAIETAYRGYMFRSRLEAKWAVFFDLCGWAWSYEPRDYGGWIPDFALGDSATLVEVKPFFHEDEWSDAIKKIVDSGCREPVILLGADPTWNIETRVTGQRGYKFGQAIIEFVPRDNYVFEITNDIEFGITIANGKPGLCVSEMIWWNPIWSLSDEDAFVELNQRDCESQLVSRWAAACNASRWMKVQK